MRLIAVSVLWVVHGLAWLALGLSLSTTGPGLLLAAGVVVLAATYGFATLIAPRRPTQTRVAPASPELVRALNRAGLIRGA